MNRTPVVLAATLAVAASAFVAIPAQAEPETSHVITPGHFVPALSDTRSGGHYEFVNDTLHISTGSNTSVDKVAEYLATGVALADAGEPSLDYTSAFGIAPGFQLVVDFDADGTPDGTLVGESVYGGDWWASNGSAAFVKSAAPSTTAGSGSQWHGTLDAWRGAFPSAVVRFFGFSLGSGVHGDGVLNSLTFAGDVYTFADLPGRVAGDDRFTTSVEVSKAAYPAGAPIVFLASGAAFPDALSAGPAAAKLGGPLLLTAPDALPAAVGAEIERLDPAEVVIVGGENAVSAAVQDAVTALVSDTSRIDGIDRFETSRNVAEYAFGADTPDAAIIATGRDFPDALVASAAIGSAGPVILVDGDSSDLDAATIGTIGDLGPADLAIAGGTDAVSPGIATALGALGTVTRLGGTDRFETAALLNGAFFSTASRAMLATASDFPDALAGTALAAKLKAPLFIVSGECVSDDVLAALEDLGVDTVTLLGGTTVLDESIADLTSCS